MPTTPNSTLFSYPTLFRSFNLTIPLQQLKGLETLVIIMVANKYAFLQIKDRKSGSAGMPRPISYAAFCLKKKIDRTQIATLSRQIGRYILDVKQRSLRHSE